MAVSSGFFNSNNGDRRYKAEFFANYFASFISNGVFPNPSTNLQVIANNDMTITVKLGKAWINGYIMFNDDDYQFNLDVADGLLSRKDRVVVRWSKLQRNIELAIKKGDYSSNPNPKDLERTADIYELALADILIKNGAVSIKQADITDLRLNNKVCGIVHGVIEQVDTNTLFLQYKNWYESKTEEAETNIKTITEQFQQDFNTWFESIKNILDSNAAGNLLNKINEIEDKVNNIQIEVIDNLTSADTDKPLSANQGKVLNKTKLTNKRRTLSVSDLNNPNYPESYICSIDFGKQVGLPTNWAFIQYFRHENNDGYGTQVAYKLNWHDPEGQPLANYWTMKVRSGGHGMTWGPWEDVITTKPKGHYPIADANLVVDDGKHYYFNSNTLNRPSFMTDGIIANYAYNVGDSPAEQSKSPFLIQMAYSWWQDKVAFRKGLNGSWGQWHEILTTNNSAFSIGTDGITMSDHSKHLRIRHIEGATTEGLDGELFLNFYNGKNIKFKALDGSIQSLQGLFQSASNGKRDIANAITGQGVPTSTTDSWQVMANNIGQIKAEGTVLTGITDQSGQYIPAVNLSKAKAVIAYVDMSEAIGSGKSGGYLMTGWYDLGINACTSFATGTQAFNRYIDLNLIVDKSSNYVKVTVENKFGYNGNLKYKSINAPVTVVIFE